MSLKFAIEKLYGKEIPRGDDFKMRAKGKMCSGVWDMYSIYFGKEIKREKIEDTNIERLTFFAERLSTGKKIAFTYKTAAFPNVDKIFLIKANPRQFRNIDFKSLKREAIVELLSAEDFSYFKER